MRLVAIAALLVSTTAYADRGDQWDGATMAEQAGAGVLGGVLIGGSILFGFEGFLKMLDEDEDAEEFAPTLGGLIVATPGIAAGVHIVGDYHGGNASFVATGTGALFGMIAVGLTLPKYKKEIPKPAVVAVGMATVLVPTILAYQIATDEKRTMVIPFAWTF